MDDEKNNFKEPKYESILGDDDIDDKNFDDLDNSETDSTESSFSSEKNIDNQDDSAEILTDEKNIKKKKKKKWPIVLIIILIILAILGAVFGFTFKKVTDILQVQKDTWTVFAHTKDDDGITEKDLENLVKALPNGYLASDAKKYSITELNVKDGYTMLISTLNQVPFSSGNIDITKVSEFRPISAKNRKDSDVEDTINSYFVGQLKGKEDQFKEVFPNTYDFYKKADAAYLIKDTLKDGTATQELQTIIIKTDGKYYDLHNLIACDMISYYYRSYLDYLNSMMGGEDVDGNSSNSSSENSKS